MRQLDFYPKTSLTFARNQPIKPEPQVWSMRFHEIEGLSVMESDHESAWQAFDEAQRAQDGEYA